jgi:hypothetical protein
MKGFAVKCFECPATHSTIGESSRRYKSVCRSPGGYRGAKIVARAFVDHVAETKHSEVVVETIELEFSDLCTGLAPKWF